jgi:hypothetical protein
VPRGDRPFAQCANLRCYTRIVLRHQFAIWRYNRRYFISTGLISLWENKFDLSTHVTIRTLEVKDAHGTLCCLATRTSATLAKGEAAPPPYISLGASSSSPSFSSCRSLVFCRPREVQVSCTTRVCQSRLQHADHPEKIGEERGLWSVTHRVHYGFGCIVHRSFSGDRRRMGC